jgi:hypothetical protein
MGNCTHPQLNRLAGPIHENDSPPVYQCEKCKAMLRVSTVADVITVNFGTEKK